MKSENAMGERSPADDTGWEWMYRWYRWGLSYLKKPEILIFHVVGDPQDYQFARYSFASSLMSDGFFKFSPEGR